MAPLYPTKCATWIAAVLRVLAAAAAAAMSAVLTSGLTSAWTSACRAAVAVSDAVAGTAAAAAAAAAVQRLELQEQGAAWTLQLAPTPGRNFPGKILGAVACRFPDRPWRPAMTPRQLWATAHPGWFVRRSSAASVVTSAAAYSVLVATVHCLRCFYPVSSPPVHSSPSSLILLWTPWKKSCPSTFVAGLAAAADWECCCCRRLPETRPHPLPTPKTWTWTSLPVVLIVTEKTKYTGNIKHKEIIILQWHLNT